MIRGAFILAVGYALGYAHATSHNENVSEAIQTIKKAWDETKQTDVVDGTVVTGEGDVKTDKATQGENPK